MKIEVPKLMKWSATCDGTWYTYDSIKLKAKELNVYSFTDKVEVFRVVVNLDADGTIDGWVVLE